jgi:5-methylcytosine-specific restriction enzyme subunit McrC
MQRVQVFEHSALAVGEEGLTARHFDTLVRYNERHGCKLFQVGHRRLHFSSYVGVLQVGGLTIEILPKAEKGQANKGKWQRALLQMLKRSGIVDTESAPEADLHLRRSSLLDLYLDCFVSEVERLSHAGLAKKYRVCEGNLYKVKGRILFRQQISRNLLHRERMYTAHQIYDADNPFNRILKKALGIVERVATRPSISARAAAAALAFESVSEVRVTSETFERLRMDRNTERYRRAISLAQLIILNYTPDLKAGREHVLAILFDMNRLFERFILAELHRAVAARVDRTFRLHGQLSHLFWSSRSIRPDVVIEFLSQQQGRVVLDTKWKIPQGDQPSDEDLKQMYAYNVHIGSAHSLLVYPRAGPAQSEMCNAYASSASLGPDHQHSCGTHFIDLFDERQNLRNDIGARLVDQILQKPVQAK